MSEKLITIKDVSLNNNCPECYSNNGLQLTYKQKFKETRFYRSITKETAQEITCKTCNTIIYPVMWTDDIERVFNYQLKAITPKKPSIKLKRPAWLLLVLIVSLLATGIALAAL